MEEKTRQKIITAALLSGRMINVVCELLCEEPPTIPRMSPIRENREMHLKINEGRWRVEVLLLSKRKSIVQAAERT